jgi:hypothetical protein
MSLCGPLELEFHLLLNKLVKSLTGLERDWQKILKMLTKSESFMAAVQMERIQKII